MSIKYDACSCEQCDASSAMQLEESAYALSLSHQVVPEGFEDVSRRLHQTVYRHHRCSCGPSWPCQRPLVEADCRPD